MRPLDSLQTWLSTYGIHLCLKLKGFAEWLQPISARKISMASEHQRLKKNNTVLTNATPQ
jgi:hypothetical protein